MVRNLESQNESVQYIAKLCFTNESICSGRNINEIISEYNIDFILKCVPCLKYDMDRMYNVRLMCSIYRQEWKIIMIHELINCLNGITENGFSDEDNQILLMIFVFLNNCHVAMFLF